MNHLLESLKLSAELQSRAAHYAALDGVPLEEWIAEAVAAKIETAEFIRSRVRASSGRTMQQILDSVPHNPPMPGDELPEGWTVGSPERSA